MKFQITNIEFDCSLEDDDWTWEETPETIEALKQLHETVKKVNERRKESN